MVSSFSDGFCWLDGAVLGLSGWSGLENGVLGVGKSPGKVLGVSVDPS